MATCKAGVLYVRVDDIETPCTAEATGSLMLMTINTPGTTVRIEVCDRHRSMITRDE